MVSRVLSSDRRPLVAFGPELAGIGSWEWVGRDLADELSGECRTTTFQDDIRDCDVAVIVKWKPPLDVVQRAARRAAVIYCPIDGYGSCAEIDADWRLLRCCRRIVVHCPILAKYYQSYAAVEVVDHHVKYAAPLRTKFVEEGPILWTGVWSNLPPLVEWVNGHDVPGELWLLTNIEGRESAEPSEFGFRRAAPIRIGRWTPERHCEWTRAARAAIDVKGDDFRQRHKPAAKALDVIASGVPLAINADSSSARYLVGLGFDVAAPEDRDRWLSRAYWEETRGFGVTVRERLSRAQVGQRFRRIIDEVLSERGIG